MKDTNIGKHLSVKIEDDLYVHIIKTGHNDLYVVILEDAYQEVTGNSRLCSAEEIQQQYAIDIETLLLKHSVFEQKVKIHSIEPNNLLYNSNAFVGESGEVANVVKKIHIKNVLQPEFRNSLKTDEEYISMLKDELGDSLFYLTRLCLDINSSLEEVMDIQRKKLMSRSMEYDRIFKK